MQPLEHAKSCWQPRLVAGEELNRATAADIAMAGGFKHPFEVAFIPKKTNKETEK